MECTFISIHDLSLDARLLYVSTSIEDILGYRPHEVVGKSCWEYFHPDEIPFARSIHGRSIQLDKAAVLNYCQIKNRNGRWVGCECVFTIVHDVLVASTSVYRRGPSSQKRAIEAPVIRQLFSSSPRDPRYHMLSYISHKFSQEIPTHINEPRAALFLNRFSRTLTIMYATNGLADLIGVTADQLTGKSFYFCIQENCLREAVKCLESAKANDSIAYLRFWFRDPTREHRQNSTRQDEDDHMTDGNSSGDEDDGGVHLSELMDHDGNENAFASDSSHSMRSSVEPQTAKPLNPNSRSSSDNSTDSDGSMQDPIFDRPAGGQSRTSSISTPDDPQSSNQSWLPEQPQIELEAVVSCTSDGLVVVLRRAKPFVPQITTTVAEGDKNQYANGFFASPWANDPILPSVQNRANPLPDPIQPSRLPMDPSPIHADLSATSGPASQDFMKSIRDVVVFAWSLTGINGSLEKHSRGTPTGESVPPGGYPIWDPNSNAAPERHSSIKLVNHGFNESPSTRAPAAGQVQRHKDLGNGYHKNRDQDHLYNTLAPSSGLVEHTQNGNYSQRHSRYDDAMETIDYGNGSLKNGYQGQAQDSGYLNQEKAEYSPYASRGYLESKPAYNGGQASRFQSGTQDTEYDPYAPAVYQGSGSGNHGQFQEPHSQNGWHVANVTQAQSNGYGH